MNFRKNLLSSIVSTMAVLSFAVNSSESTPVAEGTISLSAIQHLMAKPSKSYSESSILSKSAVTSVIDVVVFYQPAFMEHWGEQDGYSRIHEWVEEANLAFVNSEIDAMYRIVKVSPTFNIPDDLAYDSELDNNGALVKRGAGDLFSQLVLNEFEGHTENELYWKYGGDLVLYVRNYQSEKYNGTPVKGYAAITGESASVFDWQVKDANVSNDTGRTIVHEFGHSLGGNHERVKNSFPAQQESYAVAYECGGKNTGIYSSSSIDSHLFYSSPEHYVAGQACGVAIGESNEADNTTVIKAGVLIAKERRPSVTSKGTVNFDDAVITVDETSSVATINISRNGDITQGASVEVAAYNGSAIQGNDFVEGFLEAVFSPGDATTSVQFTISQNSEIEENESFTISFRYPYELTAGADSTVVIASNEASATGDFKFGVATGFEQAQSVCVPVQRTNGSKGEVVFLVETQEGSATDADFILDENTLVFSDGEISKEICLTLIDDSIDEGNETFSILLSTDSDVSYETSTSVIIKDNDGPDNAVGELRFSITDLTVAEEDGTATLTVLRENGSDGDITVNVIMAYGTASSSDISLTTKTLTLLDGVTSGVVTLSLFNDTLVESNETVSVTLSAGTPSTLIVDTTPVQVTVTSSDLDAPVKSSDGGSGGSFGYLLLFIPMILCRRIL